MFLRQLKEKNKELFLEVCVHASLSNGVFADEEKEMLSEYCREMNILEVIPEHDRSIEEVLEMLSNQADEREKNIIVLEILGLVKVDGEYDDKEKDFMYKLIKKLDVKEEVLHRLESLLEIYTVVCREMQATILG